MSSGKQRVQQVDQDDDEDNDDTTFISTCHSVRFEAPVSHICNCVYHITTPNRVNIAPKPRKQSQQKPSNQPPNQSFKQFRL